MSRFSIYAWFLRFGLGALLRSCLWQFEGDQVLSSCAAKAPCILALWHRKLLLVAPLLQRCAPQFSYCALVSHSRDGQLLSAFARTYRQGSVIGVPHDRRSQALKSLIMSLREKQSIAIVTPDGPRGPGCRVKPGIAMAAVHAQATVLPVTWHASSLWELPTWDRMVLPKPFSTITVSFGRPIVSSSSIREREEASPEDLPIDHMRILAEQKRIQLEGALLQLDRKA